jgi:predicted RNA methylase
MKRLGQYIFYFFSSVSNRGFVFTLQLLWNELKWERKLGINTLQIENLPDGIAKEDFYHYQGASYFILQHMLTRVPKEIQRGGFIDYGCGKGRAMIMAAMNGFKNVQGIDLSENLIAIAKANVSTSKKWSADANFVFHCENAEKFSLPTEISLVYLFNPFGETVMKKVVEACITSLKVNPRELYVLYVNPKHLSCWSSDFEVIYNLRSKKYTEAVLMNCTKFKSISG